MKIRFYLKRPDSSEPTAIFATVSYNGHSLKVYFSESIHPKHWNKKTQTAKATASFPEHPEFNQRLLNFKSTVSKIMLEYKNNNEHAAPSPATFKALIDRAMNKGQAKVTFLEYYQDFYNRTMNGERHDPRTRKAIGKGVGKGYGTTLQHLKTFAKTYKIDFANIDMDFYRAYIAFLKAKPLCLADNTIGQHIQRIKAVMNEATEAGINTNMAFKSKAFVKPAEDADTIYLNNKELQEMIALDLTGRIAEARDSFLIGCYTGLRFSDYSILAPEKIKDGFIHITQTKTGSPVTIPLHPEVKKILAKRDGNLPKTITNQETNRFLKTIGKMMPSLNVTESKTITKGGTKITRSIPKYELLTTHTARRSFATNEYLAGTSTLIIMAITGHKTEKAFLKYIKVSSNEHAKNLHAIWQTREAGQLKAV